MGNWLLDLFRKSKKRDSTIYIESPDSNMSITEVLSLYEKVIAREAVRKIGIAIDKKADRAEIATIYISRYNSWNIGCGKQVFERELSYYMEKLLKHEDYRMCGIAQVYIEKLQESSPLQKISEVL